MQNLEHLNECFNVSCWGDELFEAAITGIANVHAIFYDQPSLLQKFKYLPGPFLKDDWIRSTELWEKMAFALKQKYPDVVSDEDYKLHMSIINNIDDWQQVIDEMPKTIVHSDYNPRNGGFRRVGNGWKVCILDWECVRWHLPQTDLVQFLLYSSRPDNIVERAGKYIEMGRKTLSDCTGKNISKTDWETGFICCLKDYMINRIPLLALIFAIYPCKELNYGTLLYRNGKTLLNNINNY